MANLQQLLNALNVHIATKAGYEADDVLGTLAQKAATEGYQVKIVSGDRDLFQLVDDERQIEEHHRRAAEQSIEGDLHGLAVDLVQARMDTQQREPEDTEHADPGGVSEALAGGFLIRDETAVHHHRIMERITPDL